MKTIALAIITSLALTSAANAQIGNEFGPDAGNGAVTGDYNTAYGDAALFLIMSGNDNTANGAGALLSNTTGSDNTALGELTLRYSQTGNGNIAIGYESAFNLTNGDNNIDIGNVGVATESGTIRMGTTGTHTNTFIAGISGVTVPNAANPVVVDSVSGQLGTVNISSLKGADGTNGVNGIGFVPGAYLYLPATATAPDGFTKIGTKTDLLTDLHGHLKTLKINVYQKN